MSKRPYSTITDNNLVVTSKRSRIFEDIAPQPPSILERTRSLRTRFWPSQLSSSSYATSRQFSSTISSQRNPSVQRDSWRQEPVSYPPQNLFSVPPRLSGGVSSLITPFNRSSALNQYRRNITSANSETKRILLDLERLGSAASPALSAERKRAWFKSMPVQMTTNALERQADVTDSHISTTPGERRHFQNVFIDQRKLETNFGATTAGRPNGIDNNTAAFGEVATGGPDKIPGESSTSRTVAPFWKKIAGSNDDASTAFLFRRPSPVGISPQPIPSNADEVISPSLPFTSATIGQPTHQQAVSSILASSSAADHSTVVVGGMAAAASSAVSAPGGMIFTTTTGVAATTPSLTTGGPTTITGVVNETKWSCSECWVGNEATAAECACCKAPKPAPKPSKVAANSINAKWTCSECWVGNEETATECACCKTPKPSAAAPKQPSKVTSSAKWTCSECWVGNEAAATECACCKTPKQQKKPTEATAVAATTTRNGGKWTCSGCWVSNDASASECVCCKTAKPTPALVPGSKQAAAEVCTCCSSNSSEKCVSCAAKRVRLEELGKSTTAPEIKTKWNCTTCFLVNDADRMKCIACQSPKPGATFKPVAIGRGLFASAVPTVPAPTTEPKKLVDNSDSTTSFLFGVPKPKDTQQPQPVVEATKPAESVVPAATLFSSSTITSTSAEPKLTDGGSSISAPFLFGAVVKPPKDKEQPQFGSNQRPLGNGSALFAFGETKQPASSLPETTTISSTSTAAEPKLTGTSTSSTTTTPFIFGTAVKPTDNKVQAPPPQSQSISFGDPKPLGNGSSSSSSMFAFGEKKRPASSLREPSLQFGAVSSGTTSSNSISAPEPKKLADTTTTTVSAMPFVFGAAVKSTDKQQPPPLSFLFGDKKPLGNGSAPFAFGETKSTQGLPTLTFSSSAAATTTTAAAGHKSVDSSGFSTTTTTTSLFGSVMPKDNQPLSSFKLGNGSSGLFSFGGGGGGEIKATFSIGQPPSTVGAMTSSSSFANLLGAPLSTGTSAAAQPPAPAVGGFAFDLKVPAAAEGTPVMNPFSLPNTPTASSSVAARKQLTAKRRGIRR